MGNQSARMFFGMKDHKDIYAAGRYHKQMYKGSQLVWEKIKRGWEKYTTDHCCICQGNGIFLAADYNYRSLTIDIFTSTDGIVWEAVNTIDLKTLFLEIANPSLQDGYRYLYVYFKNGYFYFIFSASYKGGTSGVYYSNYYTVTTADFISFNAIKPTTTGGSGYTHVMEYIYTDNFERLQFDFNGDQVIGYSTSYGIYMSNDFYNWEKVAVHRYTIPPGSNWYHTNRIALKNGCAYMNGYWYFAGTVTDYSGDISPVTSIKRSTYFFKTNDFNTIINVQIDGEDVSTLADIQSYQQYISYKGTVSLDLANWYEGFHIMLGITESAGEQITHSYFNTAIDNKVFSITVGTQRANFWKTILVYCKDTLLNNDILEVVYNVDGSINQIFKKDNKYIAWNSSGTRVYIREEE